MADSLNQAAFQSLRPPFLLLTPVCVFLGIAVAITDYPSVQLQLLWPVFILALSAHGAVNALNEYLDFKSGLDEITQRTPFSGGSGALVAQPGAINRVLILVLICLGLTISSGLYLVYLRGIELLWAGVVGVTIILAYTRIINRMPLLCLMTPGFAFGPLMTGGTYWVLTGQLNWHVMLVSLPVFFMVNNLLLINQIPDVEADAQVGRRTFPIVFGIECTLKVYLLFAALTTVSAAYVVFAYQLAWLILILLVPLTLPFVVWLGLRAKDGEVSSMLPFMGINVLANMLIPVAIGGTILLN